MKQAVSSIATALGLDALRPGRHILRDAKRIRTAELTVTNVWHATICPTFHDRGVVAVIRAEDTEFRGKVTPGFLRAAVAVVGIETEALRQTVTADIDNDPLPPAVQSLDILSSTNSLCLDGIGYELHTLTHACRATLQFSNPSVDCFRAIETALFNLARSVATTSGDATIAGFVATWHDYLKDAGRTT